MGEIRCADVLEWLRAAVQTERLAPTPAIQEHVAGCATCQAALPLLASEALGLLAPPAAIDCRRCLEDLPAFVEREREDPMQAIRAYPHVWWHLWTCDTCAETYRLTRALVGAEQRGEIATPAISDTAAAPTPRLQQIVLRLTRQLLTRALPAPMLLARVMRGHDEGPIVLSQREGVADRHFILSVEEQPNRDWSVRVIMTPPLAGWLVLTLGETVFRAYFDAQGIAVVADVPAELLAGVEGPDLVVGLEPDA